MRLVAAALALLVSASTAQADLRKEWVEYNHGTTKLKSYLVYDDKAAGKVAPLAAVDKVVAALRAARVRFQYELYSGADHGFSTPQNADEERANVQSIASSTRYLKEVLGR